MKITAISDTHNTFPNLPDGDLWIHAGDWTYLGKQDEIRRNQDWINSQKDKFKYRIGVAGNHDFDFNHNTFKDFTLLFDEEIEIEGLRIYGTPYVPVFGKWAFMKYEEQLRNDVYSKIPEGLDILICHGPAFGFLDISKKGDRCGSKAMREKLISMKDPPKHFIFGHIHSDWNSPEKSMFFNGINFHNVSYLDESYCEGFNTIVTFEVNK